MSNENSAGKRFLARGVNPSGILPEAEKRHLDLYMCVACDDDREWCVQNAPDANRYDVNLFSLARKATDTVRS